MVGASGAADSTIFFSTPMIIKNSGNVGIGTNSPNKALTVYGGNDNGIWIDSNGNQYTTLALGRSGVEKANFAWDNTNSILGTITYGASSMTFSPNSTEAMRIANGGNGGIGTTSPRNLLELNKNTTGQVAIEITNTTATSGTSRLILNSSSDTNSNGFHIINNANDGQVNLLNYKNTNLALWTNGVERVTINNSGKVGIGTTSPSTALEVNGTATVTALVETSTRELKENIETLEDQSTIVDSLQPVSYTWKEDGKEDFGLIAEDVADIAPHLVSRNEDGKPTGIKYSKLSVLLLDVVQKQNTLINNLNERITKLENERGN